MPKIEACIFDLDGVVVDTAKYHYMAWKKLANDLNFNFTEEQNERLKGVSRMESLEILLEIGGLTFDASAKEALAEKKNTCYVNLISQMTPEEILPGVKDFMKQLKEYNIKIALGSVSKNSMTILKNIGMVSYFDSIIDGTKIKNAKPDPEVFLLGAKEMNVDPKNCVVFEDSVAGIEAAIRGEMYSIGIGSPQILSKANLVISSFHEMSVEKLNHI